MTRVRRPSDDQSPPPSPRRILAHFRGCLLGGAVGDALGATVEFDSWEAIRLRFGDSGLRELAPAYGRVGAITDDTQMTLFTAEGLIRAFHRAERGLVSISGVVHNAYLRWLVTQGGTRNVRRMDRTGWLIRQRVLHARRAPGTTCISALESGAMGTLRDPINDSKGCGGVMRVAPVGLAKWIDPLEIGCELAAITHGHATGFLAAGFFAQLIFELADGHGLLEGIDRVLFRLRQVPAHDETVAAVEAAVRLSTDARGTPAEVESLGQGWTAEEALAIGLFAALIAKDFEHGVLVAVNHGGDSDSTGSIAGNILGLLLGEHAIPNRWLEQLEGRELIAEVGADLWRHFGDGAAAEEPFCDQLDKYPPN